MIASPRSQQIRRRQPLDASPSKGEYMLDGQTPSQGGAPRDAYADPDFVIVRMTAVRALGSWEAAGCFQRIAWRCEQTGSWKATIEEIAEQIGVSVRTTQRIVNRLREAGWVTSEREDRYDPTLTWRVAWADCQSGSDVSPTSHTDNVAASEDASSAASETASLAASSSSETGKTSKTSTGARGTRLAEDWQPDDDLKEWFRQQPFRTFINPVIETQKFIDYWHDQTGQRANKKDWRGTWRNWMRTAAQRAGWTGQSDEDLGQHAAKVVGLFD